ncbi:hypothetical protein F4604DRAFT_2009893 [Suillus subluteus]|nr:hypothetical protein F4604DRAFT_2009893 [Suillus subluteus]
MVNLTSWIASLLCIAHPTKLGQKAPANKQNISQPITPDLETQHSNDIDRPAMRTDQTRSVGAVIADGERLVDKRDKIIHSVNLHEGLGPAVSRLPAELLSEIFMHTLPSFDELLPPSKLRSPMLLTRICRRWREVVVDTPSLWCRLFGGYKSSQRGHRPQEAFCYNTWLKRSRGLPLSLALTCRTNHLTSLLQPYTNQISSLRIVYCAATRDLLLSDLPALQVLIVDGWISDFQFQESAIAQSILNHSFTLRSLKVSRPSSSFYLAGFHSFKNSRWPHLTHAHVEITVYQQDLLILLQQAPNLSSAKIFVAVLTAHPPLPVEPCTHTKLQVLHINCSQSPLAFPNLLNALSLPNLRELMAGALCMQWPHEEFKAFLARSKCPLEFLSSGDAMTASELDELRAEYIALIPSLEVVVDPATISSYF